MEDNTPTDVEEPRTYSEIEKEIGEQMQEQHEVAMTRCDKRVTR